MDKEEIRAMMKRETWMNAKESIANGFVDEIIGEQVDIRQEKVESSHMSFLNRLTNPSSEESIERIAALEADLSAQAAEFQAKLDAAELALQEAAEITAENIELRIKADLVPALEAKIAEMEEIAIITAEKIDTAAAQKLASMGHGEPLDLGTVSVTNQETLSILEVFKELKGEEATRFYEANRKAILAEQSQINS
jgi:hypothetical protein